MSYSFNGTTSALTSTLNAHGAQRSYSVWVNRAGAHENGLGRIFDKRNAGAQTETLYETDSDGNLYFERNWSGGVGQWTTPRPASGAFHHILVTYDAGSTSNDPIFYIDGVLSTTSDQIAPSGTVNSTTDTYVIGNRGAGDRTWNGLIAEFAIWNEILTAADAQALASGAYPRNIGSSMIRYWRLRDSGELTDVLSGDVLTNSNATHSASHPTVAESDPVWFGVLQPSTDPDDLQALADAGVTRVVVNAFWDQAHTADATFSSSYFDGLRASLALYRSYGFRVYIDLGLQYVPSWVEAISGARYKNQYGDDWVQTNASGDNCVDVVYNATIRNHAKAYITRLASEIGQNIQGVRIGCGPAGELHYPDQAFNSQTNSHWAFSDAANALKTGAYASISGWTPGTADTAKAQVFLDFIVDHIVGYMDDMMGHIEALWPSAELCPLFPGWGWRAGQEAAAVAVSLDGSTGPEVPNGEICRGHRWTDHIPAMAPYGSKAVVWCTWIDAPTAWGVTPPQYLATIKADQPLVGENTGGGDADRMDVTEGRILDSGLVGVAWAFMDDLFDAAAPDITDYAALVDGYGYEELLPELTGASNFTLLGIG